MKWIHIPMFLVTHSVTEPDLQLPTVAVRVERQKLAKRLWRSVADDGTEFGCELDAPLSPGATVYQNGETRYVIVQEPEPVLEISLRLAASAAAGIGWAIGNLHLELMSEPERLLTPDESASRQLLGRIGIPFRETRCVFRPGRFARGVRHEAPNAADCQELGASHKH